MIKKVECSHDSSNSPRLPNVSITPFCCTLRNPPEHLFLSRTTLPAWKQSWKKKVKTNVISTIVLRQISLESINQNSIIYRNDPQKGWFKMVINFEAIVRLVGPFVWHNQHFDSLNWLEGVFEFISLIAWLTEWIPAMNWKKAGFTISIKGTLQKFYPSREELRLVDIWVNRQMLHSHCKTTAPC